jgi:hypothetical protein
MKHQILLSFFCVALTGCTTVERRLPVGMYQEKATPNFVRVSSEQLHVHIKGVDERDSNNAGLAFKYVLWPDGRLFLVVSRSVELTYGYPALEYYWHGSEIVARDTKSNLRWEFSLQR